MSEQEYRNVQHGDPQKPEDRKPVTQPNVPVPPKQEIPIGQPFDPGRGNYPHCLGALAEILRSHCDSGSARRHPRVKC
jgi:hypothetical protein